MARPLRIGLAGGRYHVTARGNERREIFRDDRDCQRFLELLAALPERFGVRLHAYVLMPNHYHLLLETPEANLSRTVQWLNVSTASGLTGAIGAAAICCKGASLARSSSRMTQGFKKWVAICI